MLFDRFFTCVTVFIHWRIPSFIWVKSEYACIASTLVLGSISFKYEFRGSYSILFIYAQMYRGNQLVTYLSKCTHLTALLAFFFVSQSASASATATVTWETPDQRENGDYLNANEIGGFELAYRLTSEPVYSSVIVEQATATH